MRMTLTATALALALPLGPALAQNSPDFGTDAAPQSPFAFAKSGEKARRGPAPAGGKVIGGQLADAGEWPWQVALLVSGMPVGPEAQFCGGTMLLDEWVLTAAHCVHMEDELGDFADLPADAISVLVGTNDLVPGQGDLVPVAAIHRFPGYVGTAFDHDIALIRLARAPQVPFATITVPDAEFGDQLDQPGVATIVTGWGLVEGGEHPTSLYETEIQMLDRAQCNAAMLDVRADEAVKGFGYAIGAFGIAEEDAYTLWDQLVARAPEAMSENMLCSGTYEGGKLACSGDSGGPLVVPLSDGSYVQAGVVSWGLSGKAGAGCKETALFSAYTRVSNYLPWLEATINQP